MEINTFENNEQDKDQIIAQLRAQLNEKDRLIESLQNQLRVNQSKSKQ